MTTEWQVEDSQDPENNESINNDEIVINESVSVDEGNETFENDENNAEKEDSKSFVRDWKDPLLCGLCNINFMSEEFLKDHNNSVHKEGRRLYHTRFICKICHSSFPYKQDLKIHMISDHRGKYYS